MQLCMSVILYGDGVISHTCADFALHAPNLIRENILSVSSKDRTNCTLCVHPYVHVYIFSLSRFCEYLNIYSLVPFMLHRHFGIEFR